MFSEIIHKKTWFYLIGSLLYLLGLPTAWAYYCAMGSKNNFIQIGDTMAKVQQQCGPPKFTEVCQHTISNSTNNQASNITVINGAYTVTNGQNAPTAERQVTQNINVTIWSYDQGLNLPEVLLEFHDGRLYQAPLPVTGYPCSGN